MNITIKRPVDELAYVPFRGWKAVSYHHSISRRSCKSASQLAFVTFVFVLSLCCLPACRKNTSKKPNSVSQTPMTFTDDVVSQHNQGVALMGQFEYSVACLIFEKLSADYPNWADVQVDLAIATLNRREPGDSEKASRVLKKVAASDAKNLRAYYCQGILALDNGDLDSALKAFSHVSKVDPTDAYAVYYTGQCMSQLSNVDGAIERYMRAIELDPYLRSAYYGAFQGLLRKGKMKEANQFREDFERLANNPQARLAEIKYTRMGPKATVLPIATNSISKNETLDGPIFSSKSKVLATLPNGFEWNAGSADTSITSCDINMDGEIDLFVANGLRINDQLRNAILLADGDSYSLTIDHPLAAPDEVNAALWGDFDNDGFTDVYFCRDGRNQLWRQTANGVWTEVTESTRTGGGDVDTRDGAFVDADHDGDLDIFLANIGPNELLSNNLDGTFRRLGADAKIAGDDVASSSVLFADLDNDRDADILVINDSPPHQVFLNDRLWSYRAATMFDPFLVADISLAVVADADVDGQLEIYTTSKAGIQAWRPDAEGEWKPKQITTPYKSARRVEVVDAQGDGAIDLIVYDSAGEHVISISPDEHVAIGTNLESIVPLRSAITAPLTTSGPTLIGFDDQQQLVSLAAGDGRRSFITVTFSGKDDQGEQMRSNRSGIGVDASARRGTNWTAFNTFRANSGPGQSLGPIQVGLGTAERLDFVQMTWPDGVFQTETNVPASVTHEIEETQRQVASCPIVFAWNGEQFKFVTDVLGVGGIGFNLGKGEYSEPRPWENLLFGPGQLRPKDGAYEIRIGEPMEEVCYLDAARLVAYDLPDGWEMALDERLGIGNPQPTGRPIFYRSDRQPITAVNDRGQNVLSEILAVDVVAAEPGKLDPRFLGRTKSHSITLTFAEPIVSDDERQLPVLLFDGWIEYPYSQTMFAAWQANASFDAPTLEAKDNNGIWEVVAEQFGYMAGMPRRSAFPIPAEKLPVGTRELRLTCNIELYWDRISIVYDELCRGANQIQLRLTSARIAEPGYATRTTLNQRRPHYDYARRTPLSDCRHMTGFYSSFGDVLPLVQSIDDASAIIGPGEEVRLSFSMPTSNIEHDESNRRFVLELNGWAKDKDLYTRDGDTVGPLPVRDDSADTKTRDEIHKRFNRRFRTGA